MPHGKPSPMPRRLLARVRDVMAGAGMAQQRLDGITNIIAADMVAEVCSVYVRRAGDMLELFATQGLQPSAVHSTRLRVGEGIVGDIAARARPLALADAQKHPSFVFRPETGEEIYHSMLGVPILRDGRVVGVLAVQNRTQRRYGEEEVETLQTVAMVLAELVVGELIGRDELRPVIGGAMAPLCLQGMRLGSGVGAGEAVLHRPRFHITRWVADDPAAEHERLARAISEMHGALDEMFQASELAGGGEHRDVLQAYRMIAEDAGWLERIDEAISSGLTAEAAVEKVHNDIRARMSQVTDPYLRERIHDLDDLANRLLGHLIGEAEPTAGMPLPEEVILVARSMGPAQLLDYDYSRLRGVVLEEGSHTAHVAIVARALDIPAIGNVKDALGKVEPGDPLIVDGDNAQVFIRPGEDARRAFVESLRAREERKAVYASLRDLPAVTLDGQSISIKINAGLPIDLRLLDDSGADGIGLYRTELLFMVAADFPGVEVQRRLYADVLDKAADKPVIFRTLDVGGDKVLPYWQRSAEENPAMGWRAIRASLDRPDMLRQQLRALIRAAASRELRLMFPMIAEVAEFKAARAWLDKELKWEKELGFPPPSKFSVGAMLEVPSLVLQLPALLKQVDFISVGSNDLFQFLFASDRGNPQLSERYDLLSPLVLTLLRSVVEQCRTAGTPVSLCGDMASRPIEAMALIGAGFRDLSVTPSSVGPIKAMIRSLSVLALCEYMNSLYDLDQHDTRQKLGSFAQEHGVII